MSYQNTALKVGNFSAVKGGHQSATCKGDDQECLPNPRKGSIALSRQNCPEKSPEFADGFCISPLDRWVKASPEI